MSDKLKQKEVKEGATALVAIVVLKARRNVFGTNGSRRRFAIQVLWHIQSGALDFDAPTD